MAEWDGEGTYHRWHENGQEAERIHETGEAVEWDDGGQKRAAGRYDQNNDKIGLWTLWHPNGQKAREENYENGELVTSPSMWDSTGKECEPRLLRNESWECI